jgi:hypothetical protein
MGTGRERYPMINVNKLFNKPNKLVRFTGLTVEQYKVLVKRLKPLWETAEFNRLWRSDRKRDLGAGRKYKVESLENKLLVILLWYRTYSVLELLGWIFQLDATNIGRLIGKLTPLLEQAADSELLIYLRSAQRRRRKIRTWDEFVEEFPDLAEIIIDSTEQRRKRPVNRRKQKNVYSGKKHAHTIKTQITVSRQGRILHVSRSYPGRIHDKTVFDREKILLYLPRKTRKRMDKGYDGVIKDNPGCNIILPHKRRRNSPSLTRGQKQANTIRARERVMGENTIARLKKYPILSDKYRSSEDSYNQHFRNIAALCNFRLLFKEEYIT